MARTAEERRLEESRARTAHWKRWGPYLSERAWGTVREDYSACGTAWEYLPARPRPLARLPLERGRHRGHLRPPPGPLLRARALERQGPDPEGAALRPHRQRGQPRRGRQGALLLPRLARRRTRTCGCLYKYPQREFPYAELVDENRRRTRQATPSSSCSTPASSRATATSTSSSSTRRPTPRTSSSGSRRQPRARRRAARPPPDALVPQHLELGRRGRQRPVAPRRAGAGPRVVASSTPPRASLRRSTATAAPELLFTENETNVRAPLRRAERRHPT